MKIRSLLASLLLFTLIACLAAGGVNPAAPIKTPTATEAAQTATVSPEQGIFQASGVPAISNRLDVGLAAQKPNPTGLVDDRLIKTYAQSKAKQNAVKS